MQDEAARKHVALNLEATRYQVMADAGLVTAVIRNLVSTAIKFTPADGNVLLCADSTTSSSGSEEILVSVKDFGVGIDADRLDQLFRTDQNYSTRGTAGETGTGMGLILCKELVEQHGGRISAESAPGKGTAISFTLPTQVP